MTASGPTSGETKRKYRRHPKPDEHAPERPPSAYVIFSNKTREDIKDQSLSFTSIAKLVGDRWQKLDPAGKEPYEAQANAAKERYNILLSAYKKTESYRDYMRYLAEFKAKNGGGVEQKRPRLEPGSSAGSVRSVDVEADFLAPAQGHLRGTSMGSFSSTMMPSPASHQAPLPPQTQIQSMTTGTSVPGSSPRSNSPAHSSVSRDNSRPPLLSAQSSLSDESARRSDSDPLARTASLTLNTPPSGTPPLPPPAPSNVGSSDYSFGPDVSRLRYPIGSLQTGPSIGPHIPGQGSSGYPFSATLHSPSTSEAPLRSRGPDLRSYLDTGRSVHPPAPFNPAAPQGTISLPPFAGSAERVGGMAAQRMLPLPRSSPTHQQQVYPPGTTRAAESPNPHRPGQEQGHGIAQATLERSESDAADALAGLAGFSSSALRPESSKPWDPAPRRRR